MKTKLLKTTAIAAAMAVAVALPLSTSAATGDKYISLTGEYVASGKADGDLTSATASATTSSDYADGLGGIAALGYYLSDNVRIEAEGAYRQLNGDTSSVTLLGTTYTIDSSDLDTKAFSAMGNVYFNIPTSGNVSPYIGAGIGWAHEVDEGGNAIAYQAMAGLDYQISENGTLFTGYRYFGTGDFEYKYNITGFGAVTESASVQAHAVDVGYRFSF